MTQLEFKIKIPANQSALPMIEWVHSQGLVYRQEWSWDREGDHYIWWFAGHCERVATVFALKWS